MTDFRIWARIEHVGPNEFLAIVTVVPENGDPSEVRTLGQLLPSLDAAQGAAKRLLAKMGGIVVRNEGRVTDIESDGI
jgi:hypothetical protein